MLTAILAQLKNVSFTSIGPFASVSPFIILWGPFTSVGPQSEGWGGGHYRLCCKLHAGTLPLHFAVFSTIHIG